MDAIDLLSSLNLKETDPQQIWSELKNIGKIGKIVTYINPGEAILRGRSINNDEELLCKSDYTYPPSKFSTTLQRASHPGLIMFYGTYVPKLLIDEGNDLSMARAAGVVEARSDLRSGDSNCVQKIAFSRWRCKEQIKLVGVFQDKNIGESNSYVQKLYSEYLEFIDRADPDIKELSIKATSFLAREFSKDDIETESDYLISAIYTELAVRNGFDGVMFPSVQTGGWGINCAINPNSADNKLDFVHAGECIVYKRKQDYIVDNLRNADIVHYNQTHFEMKPVDSHLHAGEKECLNRLGLNNIEELLENK